MLAICMLFAMCACGEKKEEAAYTPVDTDTVAVGAVIIARDDLISRLKKEGVPKYVNLGGEE